MLALILCLVPQDLPTHAPRLQSLAEDTLAAWSEHLAPSPAESQWQRIDWQDSISGGLDTASRTKRPMLLWLMNGHPLGCT